MFVRGIGDGSILRLCVTRFFYSSSERVVVYMFVSGIGVGSILLLCLLDCIAVLTVWLSICLLMVSVLALFYYCVY